MKSRLAGQAKTPNGPQNRLLRKKVGLSFKKGARVISAKSQTKEAPSSFPCETLTAHQKLAGLALEGLWKTGTAAKRTREQKHLPAGCTSVAAFSLAPCQPHPKHGHKEQANLVSNIPAWLGATRGLVPVLPGSDLRWEFAGTAHNSCGGLEIQKLGARGYGETQQTM